MNTYEARDIGRRHCKTEGSAHYKHGEQVEPLDLMISAGIAKDFCLGNIIKYAARFKESGDVTDLRKISDYAHILAGLQIGDTYD